MNDEHTTFQSLLDCIRHAETFALQLKRLRPDQQWDKVALQFAETRELLNRLVGSGAVKGSGRIIQ